jgi:Family of unknown function (DUF6328)
VRSAGLPENQDDDASPDGRRESEAQRADRNLGELLQELRVLSLGVQVLFGFLLSLPFATRFGKLNGIQRDLYIACLVLCAMSTTFLIGPVAYHRLVFRRGMKESVLRFANALAICGLACVGAAILLAVLMVAYYVAGALAAALITAVLACMLGGLWFAVPLWRRGGAS